MGGLTGLTRAFIHGIGVGFSFSFSFRKPTISVRIVMNSEFV
jgi:hypothetical protein